MGFKCFKRCKNVQFSQHLWKRFGKTLVDFTFNQFTFCGRIHDELIFFVFSRIFEFRKIIGDREKCKSLVPKDYPVYINKVLFLFSSWVLNLIVLADTVSVFFFYQTEENNDCYIHEGYFISPLECFVPGILPPEAVKAR